MATTKMIAHLVNQQVVHELLALELLTLFLTNPTEDSVEIAADFMIECGQVLSEATPAGVNAIFESFRTILHDGQIDKKVQYTLENLFAVRKTRFSAHPGVIQELDLVEESDKITHTVSLEDNLDGEDQCNLFQFDPNYEQTEAEWDEIKKEILGEEAQRINQQPGMVAAGEGEESAGEVEEVDNNQKVRYQLPSNQFI
jgi:pre-mRNA-splicing factor CWC22